MSWCTVLRYAIRLMAARFTLNGEAAENVLADVQAFHERNRFEPDHDR